MDFNQEYNDLKVYKNKLQDKFISKYLPSDPIHTPSDYELDVSSFVVLFHAASEQFVENLVEKTVEKAFELWADHGKYTRTILSLVAHKCENIKYDLNIGATKSVSSVLKEEITKKKSQFIKSLAANHGVGVAYLCDILPPIGVEVFYDPNLENSLKKIVEHRGEFAHKIRQRTLSPEDALRYADDCLDYFQKISKNAENALSS